MQSITRSALRSILLEIKGARILTVCVESVPKWKGGQKSPMAGVKKASRLNVMVNFSYRNGKAKAEGVDASAVEVKERAWGQHILTQGANSPRLTPFVFHGPTFQATGERYLLTADEMAAIPDSEVYVEVKIQKSFGHSYVGTDGKVYSDAEVAEYLPASRERDPNAPCDYKLENIVSLTVKGETYAVVGATAAQAKAEAGAEKLAAAKLKADLEFVAALASALEMMGEVEEIETVNA